MHAPHDGRAPRFRRPHDGLHPHRNPVEERDLVTAHGVDDLEYRRKTPMLVPTLGRRETEMPHFPRGLQSVLTRRARRFFSAESAEQVRASPELSREFHVPVIMGHIHPRSCPTFFAPSGAPRVERFGGVLRQLQHAPFRRLPPHAESAPTRTCLLAPIAIMRSHLPLRSGGELASRRPEKLTWGGRPTSRPEPHHPMSTLPATRGQGKRMRFPSWLTCCPTTTRKRAVAVDCFSAARANTTEVGLRHQTGLRRDP